MPHSSSFACWWNIYSKAKEEEDKGCDQGRVEKIKKMGMSRIEFMEKAIEREKKKKKGFNLQGVIKTIDCQNPIGGPKH